MSNVPTNLIPTTVTGLPEYTGSSTLGYLPYVVEGRTYKVQFSNIAAVGAVPSSRTIATGTGLTGGGDLSADRTIAIANGGVGTAQLAASGVSAGVYGSGTLVPVLTVDATGRVTSATTAAVSVSGFVPTSRSVIAGTGLTGGGALTSDVTLNVNFSSSTPQALGTATAGVSTAAARGDHVHPAVNLADTSQTQGALPLGRGGTGDALSPVAGAVVYSTGTRFALTALGLPGQVLMSDGANAPQWATVSGVGTVTSVNVSGGTTGLTFSGGPVTAAGTITMAGTLAVGNGGTGVTSSTGTGSVVLSTSPTLVTPTLGVASATSIATGLGAVGAPSHTFTGDTTTGMWSPAGNTLAFSTAGTERMRIRSNGRVGVNVDPGAQFQVRGPASDTMAEVAVLQSINVAGTDTHGLSISADAVGNIVQLASTGNNAGGFTFLTGSAERMRIDSNGNVGIGTASPGDSLEIAPAVNGGGLTVKRTNGIPAITLVANPASDAIINFGDTDSSVVGGIQYTNASNAFRFITNNAERMRITDTGRVGIGTTSPEATLVVAGTAGSIAGAGLAVSETSTGNSARLRIVQSAGFVTYDATYSTGGNQQVWSNAGVERMRLTEAGNLGIGLANPSTTLDVANATGGTIRVQTTSSGNAILWAQTLGGGVAVLDLQTPTGLNRIIGGVGGTSNLSFYTASTERMRIDSVGNVGIGTSSPASRLDVSGGNITLDNTRGLAFRDNAGSIETVVGITSANNVSISAPTLSGSLQYGPRSTSGVHQFFTNATERMRIKSTGQVRFVPLAAAPGSPEAGDVYYDSTTNKLRCYNGTTWNDLF